MHEGITFKPHPSALNSIFIKVPEHHPQLQVYFPHGESPQLVPVRTAIDQVRVAELGPPTHKHLGDLLTHCPRRPPGGTLHFMEAWRGGDVTEAISVELIAAEAVLMPNLHMDLGPTCVMGKKGWG